MLLDKFVDIRIGSANLKRLQSLGYQNLIVGEIARIDIIHLALNSHLIIRCKCDICGRDSQIRYSSYNLNKKNYGIYTCHDCSQEKSKKTNLERYGVLFPGQSAEIRKKQIQTNLEKYGVEHYFLLPDVRKDALILSKSDESKEKRKQTNLNRWGVDNASKSKIIKEKTATTNIQRYGVKSPAMSSEVKEKYLEKILEKAKQRYNLNILKYENYSYFIECESCNQIYSIDTTLLYYRYNNNQMLCTFCNNPIDNHCSEFESSVYEFIKQIWEGECIRSYKYDNKKEIDIFIPELNLAIECNGIFWHSERFKRNDYHLEKFNYLKNLGIHLIYVWEDDWNFKSDIVKSILKNKLKLSEKKIYARKCEVRLVEDVKIIKDFLNNNHIQGYVACKWNIGIYYKDKLVSLMCFSKKRKEMELCRFCSCVGMNVLGAGSKLFKYFTKRFDFDTICSYADMSMFNGGFYSSIGFSFEHMCKPNYWWVIGNTRQHRFKWRKSRLVSMGYDPNKTEKEIMNSLKYNRIFGVGLAKYVYKKK
jgi:hypothetical protein